jgi:hypothetical protein
MKQFYSKKLFVLVFLVSIFTAAYHQIQKNFEIPFKNSTSLKILDNCESAQNIQLNYEMGMSTGQLNWEGELPQNGWIILIGHQGSIDINWFLADPENFEQPEVRYIRSNGNSQYLYMNMFNPAPYEIYVIADCGEAGMMVGEPMNFEMGERGQEEIGACESPTSFNAVQNEPRTMDISWNPQDGELYQIAWGPFGMEMHEGFFHDPQAGTVITSENPYRVILRQPGADEQKSFFLRKYCGGNGFSEWITPFCGAPSGLESLVGDENVLLNWAPLDGTDAWQVAYAPQGFDLNAPDPTIQWANVYGQVGWTIPNLSLQQGIVYDFYVRTICNGNNYSEWAGPGNFSTVFVPCEVVDEVLISHVTHQSADIRWTPMSGESQWVVTYGLAPLDFQNAQSMSVTQPKAILMGLEDSSVYEFIITANCPSGQISQTDRFTFITTEGDDMYCIPYFLTGCSYDFIDHLIIDGENDSRIFDLNTGCTDSNYLKQTDISVDLAPGNQYFTRVYKGNSNVSGDHLAIWIDLNDDGIFDNETERMGEGSLQAGGFTHVNFTIPTNANPGAHRMRAMLAFQAYSYMLTPCNDGANYSTNGEVHDYTVNILEIPDCSTVQAGTVADNFMVCPKDDFMISTVGSSEVAEGLTRKWQSSPAGQNNWTDVPGGLLPTTHIYGGIENPTDYRYVVSCSLTGQTSTSEVIQVGMSTNCYCMPEANCSGPGGLQINNVRLIGETVVLDNTSGCSGGGYGDFRLEFPPDLEKGQTYSLSVTANNANLNDDKIKAWIDFNRNNVFEPSEAIMDFPNGLPGYTVNSSFTIPTTIHSGLYRMRVRIGWWGSPTLTGCSVLGWGETEDYLVEIIPGQFPDACPQPLNVTIQQGDDPALATVNWNAGGTETQWEMVYGEVGFDPNSATPILIQNTPSYVLEGLSPNTTYEVYVRAICNEALESDWTGPKVFETGGMAVTDVEFEGFSFYPVPVESKLNLKSMMKVEKVEIFNLSGQKLKEFKLNLKNSELDLTSLSTGVYVMKVQVNGKTRSFKLIKK